MHDNWAERDLRWKYTANYRKDGTCLDILMCPLTGHKVELDGRIGNDSVSETFVKYKELPDFLARHEIPSPSKYKAAWESQHP